MTKYLVLLFLVLPWAATVHAAGPTYTDPAVTER